MDPNELVAGVAITMGLALTLLVAIRIPALFADTSRLNKSDDWITDYASQQKTPTGTRLTPYTLQLITPHLNAGETLKGFARAFYDPHRACDWKFGTTLEKLPLVVAATSHRILLFEVTLLTVHRTCFIPHEEIAYVLPPKPGFLGTSGRAKIGLKSGREYQMRFFGPILDEEGMRQEQSLAAHFREIAPRFGSAPERAAA